MPVQKWNFRSNSLIRVGRANNNDVVLYSVVVSRYHLQIKLMGNNWALTSLGSNGTFINGRKIKNVLVKHGMVIRLASSGPKIRITLKEVGNSPEAVETEPSKTKLKSNNIVKETVLN